MILCFELSMPSRGSWDGRWSGEERRYMKFVNFGTSKAAVAKAEEIARGRFTHAWEDGWCARVSVRIVSASEANRLRKQSDGFCGYDWMVDSIVRYGRIEIDAREVAR